MNSLPKTVTRQRRSCDLNPGPTAPESSTLTTRLPSQPDFGRYTFPSHRQYEADVGQESESYAYSNGRVRERS